MARTPEERRTLAMMAIEAVSEGESLRKVSRRIDVPASRLLAYIDECNLSEQYSRARIDGYTGKLEEIEDDAEAILEEVKQGKIADPASVLAAMKELRTIRQWNAGKFARLLFGDKTQVEHSGKIETTAPLDPAKALAAAQEAEQAGEV